MAEASCVEHFSPLTGGLGSASHGGGGTLPVDCSSSLVSSSASAMGTMLLFRSGQNNLKSRSSTNESVEDASAIAKSAGGFSRLAA